MGTIVMKEGTTEEAPDDAVMAARPDFGAFYREAHPTVARALALTLADVALAEEAADEAMVRCYSRWASVQQRDNKLSWVYRTGLQWALSKRHRSLSAPRFRASGPQSFPPATDTAILDALAGLDVDLRSVVVCRYLFGWSVDETADALGIRQGTADARIQQALAQIQVNLDR